MHPFRTLAHLALLIGGLSTGAAAQNTWLQPTSRWSEQSSRLENGAEHHHLTYTYRIAGDTVAGAYTYLRVVQEGVDTVTADGQSDEVVPIATEAGLLREDTAASRWYILLPDLSEEVLLYDFDLSLGDTIRDIYGDCSAGPAVIGIDTVEIAGQLRRRFHTDLADSYIIEGIGANTGLLGQLCPGLEGNSCLLTYFLGNDSLFVNGCAVNNTGIAELRQASPLTVFPNPTVGPCTLGTAWRGHHVGLRDSLGRALGAYTVDGSGGLDLSGLKAGVYLLEVDGRVMRILKQ